MNGEYTKDSVELFGKKLEKLAEGLYVLQELKKWIEHQLKEVEPCDWANLKGVKKKIEELEE